MKHRHAISSTIRLLLHALYHTASRIPHTIVPCFCTPFLPMFFINYTVMQKMYIL